MSATMTAQGICCFEFANCSIRVFDPVVALSMFDKARTLVPSTHVPPPAVIRLNDLISSPVDRFADDGLKFERPTVSSPVDHLDITGCVNFIGMHCPDQPAEAATRLSENEEFKDGAELETRISPSLQSPIASNVNAGITRVLPRRNRRSSKRTQNSCSTTSSPRSLTEAEVPVEAEFEKSPVDLFAADGPPSERPISSGSPADSSHAAAASNINEVIVDRLPRRNRRIPKRKKKPRSRTTSPRSLASPTSKQLTQLPMTSLSTQKSCTSTTLPLEMANVVAELANLAKLVKTTECENLRTLEDLNKKIALLC